MGSLTNGLDQLSLSLNHDTSESMPWQSSPARWDNLPHECQEAIVAVLDDDIGSLASLLQVNRQCFFLVVPRLYRDPFQRIQDISRRNGNSLRLSYNRIGIPAPHPPISTSVASQFVPEVQSCQLSTPAPAPIPTDSQRTKDLFVKDMRKIESVFAERLLQRELSLLCTLFSTLIQQLCVRFPKLYHHFSPPPRDLPRELKDIKKRPFDYGPYFREVTWTSQCYLRHMVVVDLEKLCTRSGPRDRPEDFESLPSGGDETAPTGRNGIFPQRFSPHWWQSDLRMIGALDYLQRALLNQPGADRIRSLRIPMHRLRTYQERHERVPRERTRRSRTERAQERAEEDRRTGDELQKLKGTVEQAATGNRNGDQQLERPAHVVDESLRPYCFTFNKLTNLRRLEVCDLAGNPCEWDTLERVLSTLQFGDHMETKGSNPLHQVREFALQTHTALCDRFTKVLKYFEYLEVLELHAICDPNGPWISGCNAKLCRSLKVLLLGTAGLYRNGGDPKPLDRDLGKFINLEELRMVITGPHQFDWIVESKREQTQRRKKRTKDVVATNLAGEIHPLHDCLPKLRKLGVIVSGTQQAESLTNCIAAFSNQLEEFVVRAPILSGFKFEHSFPHLTRLALRGELLLRFDYSSLVKHCPLVELLMLQHSSYIWNHTVAPDNNAMVAALVQLSHLRCLYLEGIWTVQDAQLLKMAEQSPSICKIAIYSCPRMTLRGFGQVDEILSSRKTKYLLKPKGLYRLSRTMSDVMSKDHQWRTTFFGRDDD